MTPFKGFIQWWKTPLTWFETLIQIKDPDRRYCMRVSLQARISELGIFEGENSRDWKQFNFRHSFQLPTNAMFSSDVGSGGELRSLFPGCTSSVQQLCSGTGLFWLPAGVKDLHRWQCPSSVEAETEDGAVRTRTGT